jgi:hypothetical protein
VVHGPERSTAPLATCLLQVESLATRLSSVGGAVALPAHCFVIAKTRQHDLMEPHAPPILKESNLEVLRWSLPALQLSTLSAGRCPILVLSAQLEDRRTHIERLGSTAAALYAGCTSGV